MWDLKFFGRLQTSLPTKYNNNLTCKSMAIKKGKTCQFSGIMGQDWHR